MKTDSEEVQKTKINTLSQCFSQNRTKYDFLQRKSHTYLCRQ